MRSIRRVTRKYRLRIDGEIGEKHAIQVNLTVGIYWLFYNVSLYTRHQINFYRMFFTDFSINSQAILLKFCSDYFHITRRLT